MEEYLRNMKNLRAQMNDFEEEAASIAVEEQKQKTAIQAMEKDLESVRLETKHLNEEANEMAKVKAQICCQTSEKQKKISFLELESTTLSQEWVNSQKLHMMTDAVSVEDSGKKLMGYAEGSELLSTDEIAKDMRFEVTASYNSLMSQLESARAKLGELKAKTSEISLNNNKSKQLIAELQVKIEVFPSKLKAMETKTLEKEHQALLSDKAGEVEYLQSLWDRINQLQGWGVASEDVDYGEGGELEILAYQRRLNAIVESSTELS